MKRRIVISMEQALSLSYATLRFVQLGWRVIRLESTPIGAALPGDPNRYIGTAVPRILSRHHTADREGFLGLAVADDDRRSYFVAPNVGKEAIALNLKDPQGRELLKTLIAKLDIDIFCCNTLPSRYRALGIDYDTLKTVRPDLIWAGISAMGPEYPDVPGYDPAIQAMAGFMEVTGNPDGPPMLSGIPIIDLKAGDEVYANVCLALAERAETGRGTEIHVSMLQAAASWLITTLPLLDFDCDPSEVTRCGNEHRKFIPVNVYPTLDGYILIAVGNDLQWERLTQLPGFRSLASAERCTNAGRAAQRAAIHQEMAKATAEVPTAELASALARSKVPHAPIHTVEQVRDMSAIASVLTNTRSPGGKLIRLPPPAVEREDAVREYGFAPRYSQHTESILAESGLSPDDVAALRTNGVIPHR